MKVTDIVLYAGETEILQFPLRAPEPWDRFHVKAVYGLDAQELNPRFYGIGTQSKNSFYHFSMKDREIVMRLVLRPNWENGETYSDLRDAVYRGISRDRTGRIEVLCKSGGSPVMHIYGQITKLEVPLFNEDPELQITIKCEKPPIFRGVAPVEYTTADFDNSGYIQLYDGASTAPHGFEMQFTLLGGLAGLSIGEDDSYDWRFYVGPDGNFQLNDKIYISSEYDAKRVYLDRLGIITDLMDRVAADSVWPIIFPGQTNLYIPGMASVLRLDFVRFYPAFWGV